MLTQLQLERHAKPWIANAGALEPEEGLRALLRGRSPYGDHATPANLAPFNDSLVSLPSDVSYGPFVDGVCDARGSNALKDFAGAVVACRRL